MHVQKFVCMIQVVVSEGAIKTKKGGFKVTKVNSLRTIGVWWGI